MVIPYHVDNDIQLHYYATNLFRRSTLQGFNFYDYAEVNICWYESTPKGELLIFSMLVYVHNLDGCIYISFADYGILRICLSYPEINVHSILL